MHHAKMFSTGEVAKLLGIARHKIEYAIANGHLPEVASVSDKRCFSGGDVKQIAEYSAPRSISRHIWSRPPDWW